MAETADITAHTPTIEGAAAHGAAPTTHEGVATEAHGTGGLPQFQFQHWAGQIAYLLILFAILYILMSRVFAPRVRKVFEARREAIEGALSSARAVQAEAAAQANAAREALKEAQANAQRTALDARAKAAAEAAERQAAQEAELHTKLADAETRIRASREKAMGQVGVIASETAEAILEKLTGAKPADGAASAAVAQLQG